MIKTQPVMPMQAADVTPHAENLTFLALPSLYLSTSLRTRLLLLLLPQSQQTDAGNLDDLESHTRNITLRLALATETSQKDFVVLVHEVQAAVVGNYTQQLVDGRKDKI